MHISRLKCVRFRFLLQKGAFWSKVERMRIAILGAGALGCYYGAKLATAGEEVAFILRSAYEPVQEKGLQVESVAGNLHLPAPEIYRTTGECGPVDLVIVCWKTISNHLLAEHLPPLLHEGTRIITLQNGMGNAETLSAYVAPERIHIGLCFVCCMMDTPGYIRHLEGGDIQFAPYVNTPEGLAQAEQYADMFRRAGINTLAFAEAEKILWCKLSWNIPFNGLCLAHGGISVRQLFQMPGEGERARHIMNEVCEVAAKRGFPLPLDIVHAQMERTSKMGDFIPSSAVDYLRGRPVEYDAIWGITLERAHEAGVAVPYWEQLCRDIQARLTPTT